MLLDSTLPLPQVSVHSYAVAYGSMFSIDCGTLVWMRIAQAALEGWIGGGIVGPGSRPTASSLEIIYSSKGSGMLPALHWRCGEDEAELTC